ncbi:MAG: hypothetical protein CMO66_07515 [Verrucomicrobiales bacterium]|nr:hypothetical protein [Verrucomicrobiales bacterium]MBR91094.1 hypothetical protein [Verrucomicrobiales bacterium]|tara:strand:+ start:31055 stop:31678 length:624 start_codon:yes stop_codon:yes gene_type:complete
MVKPVNSIATAEPLRDVRLADAPAPAEPGRVPEELLREHEEAGYNRGREEAAAEYETRLQALRAEMDTASRNGVTNLLANLEETVQAQLTRRLQDLEGELIEFSTEAAIRLVNSVPITTEIIEASIREAVANAEQNTEVVVFVNPEDIKMLRADESEILEQSPHERRMQFVVDPKISQGGCVVETNCGLIDGQRETRIELLKQTVNT